MEFDKYYLRVYGKKPEDYNRAYQAWKAWAAYRRTTMLPKELTITEEDLQGEYADCVDCWVARALKRAGVTLDKDEGLYVAGYGNIKDEDGFVGQYKWADGEEFNSGTKRTGKLVLAS